MPIAVKYMDMLLSMWYVSENGDLKNCYCIPLKHMISLNIALEWVSNKKEKISFNVPALLPCLVITFNIKQDYLTDYPCYFILSLKIHSKTNPAL